MVRLAAEGRSVLLIAPTGAGKTLAGFLPSLIDLAAAGDAVDKLHTLYISPLKALATDIHRNLQAPISEMGLQLRVETRSGDTPQNRRERQRVRPPQMLLTTPESLALPEGASVAEQEGRRIRIAFDADRIGAPDLVRSVLRDHDVVDLAVQEARIEDVVRRLYSSG